MAQGKVFFLEFLRALKLVLHINGERTEKPPNCITRLEFDCGSCCCKVCTNREVCPQRIKAFCAKKKEVVLTNQKLKIMKSAIYECR
ncbi:hypothetical protein RIF29_08701 [Crotalaria pallida]|uniref:Uncharacterized protein n=1 Tax=Crotalaria pallida TaxID=3830 RepID=A0AAN9IKE8_CROPI